MNCLTVQQMYSFLDGDLPPAEKENIEKHLAACEACRKALDARRCLDEAASALPDVAVPEDFCAQVMARLPLAPIPAPAKSRRKLVFAASGIAAIPIGVFLAAVFWGPGFSAFLQKAEETFGAYLHNAANFAAKVVKIIVLAGKILGDLAGQILGTLRAITDMIGAEAIAVLAAGTLLILVTGGYFLRRRILFAGRRHEN